MKVLMVNTPNSVNLRGGDLVQLRQTAAALRKLGVEVDESFEEQPDARGFDLAHVFNLRTIQSTAAQVEHLKHFGIPIVMSPIYLNPSFALWATRLVRSMFTKSFSDEQLSQALAGLRNRTLGVKFSGNVLTAHGNNRPFKNYDQRQRNILENVNYLLPNSWLEMDQLVKTLRFGNTPFSVVPYAVDPTLFLDPSPDLFIEKYGLKDFILQAGRLELAKNQLLLSYALKDIDTPLVLIGQPTPEYADLCQKYGPKSLKIIPHLPPEELASAYAAARVHVLPSWVETCGLVTMEAALANCNLVVSMAGYELEYYRDFAYYCDPSDVENIRQSVLSAWQNYEQDAPRRQQLKQLILQNYTWERAAQMTFAAYQQVLH